MNLGDAIREKARERGLTQGELARRAGLSREYVNRVVNGKASGVARLREFALGLNVRPSQITLKADRLSGSRKGGKAERTKQTSGKKAT